MAKYTADLGFDKLVFFANFAEASAPIYYEGPDGEQVSTPYQTADACHDADRALRLIVEHLGSDYYADPSSSRSDEAQLDALLESVEMTVEDEDGYIEEVP